MNINRCVSYTIGPYRFTKEQPTHLVPKGLAARLKEEPAFIFDKPRPRTEWKPFTKKVVLAYWTGQIIGSLLPSWIKIAEMLEKEGYDPIFVNVYGKAREQELAFLDKTGYAHYEPVADQERYKVKMGETIPETYRDYDLKEILAFHLWRLRITDPITISMDYQFTINFIRDLEDFISHHKPNIIFTWGDMAYRRRALTRIGEKAGIPVIRVEGGFFPASLTMDRTGMYFNKENDFTKIWKYTKDEPLSRSQKERLEKFLQDWKIAGASKYTHSRFQGPQHSLSKEHLRTKFNISPENKVLFVPCQTTRDATMFYPERLIQTKEELVKVACEALKNDKDWKVIIKPHPYENEGDLRKIISPYKNAQLVTGVSVVSLCDLADVVLTINSTVGFEALCLEKPVVTLGNNIYTGKGLTFDMVDDSRPSPLNYLGEIIKKAQPPDTQLLERFLYRIIFNYLFFYNMDNHRLNQVLRGKPKAAIIGKRLPKDRWIFGPMAQHIQKNAQDTEVDILEEPDGEEDVVHYFRPLDAKNNSIPYVVSFHGHLPGLTNSIEAKRIYQNAERVIAVFEGADSSLRENYKIDPMQIRVIHAGADPNEFRITPKSKHERFNVGIISAYRPKHGLIKDPKGAGAILEMAKGLSPDEFGFVFIGTNWRWFSNGLQFKGFNSKYYGREDGITYEDYPRLYKEIDCLLIPSKMEGGPVALYEAMMCGLPVIARPVGVVPEFVENGKTGFIFDMPGEGAGVLQEARQITWKPQEIRAKVINYTWERWAREHERVYWQVWLDQGVA